jgi:hypothetical protein
MHAWTWAQVQAVVIGSGRPLSPMPLWMSGRRRRGLSAVEQAEDLTCDVALEAADHLFTSTEVVYGVTGIDVTSLPKYGVSP